jgi:DNA-binding beta-propeller fold protein YncE
MPAGQRHWTIALWLALAACSGGASRADRLFVTQAGSKNVAVLDGSSGAVLAHTEVGLLPHNLVLSPDGQRLYVAVVGSQAIAELDTATFALRRTLLTEPVPALRDDGTIIQGHRDRDAFSHATCFDCHTGEADAPAPKYPGTRPFGLSLSPDGTRLLVSHLRSASLVEVDLAAWSVARTVHLDPSGAATEPVALARLGGEVLVALRPPQPSTAAGAVRRLEAATLAPLGEVPAGADPTELLALPARKTLLRSDFETNTVTEEDASGVLRAFTAAPGPLGLLPLSDGRQVLALDYYSNAASLLDLDTGTAGTVKLEKDGVGFDNPTHAALSGDGRTAWIVSGATVGRLLAFDLAARRVVRAFSIDGLSFGVAVLPGDGR